MILQDEPTISAVEIPWAPILAVIATVSVFAIAQGLSYPLFTFLMKEQGMSPAMIGLSAAMTPLGLIVSAPFVPYAARRFGQAPLVVFCALAAAALFLAVGLLKNEFAWFFLRFLIGVVIDPLYVLSEVWMLSLAPPSKRGRLMGIYTAIIGAGFAAGPFSLMLVGSKGWAPFAIGMTAFMLCALLLSIVARRLPSMNDGQEHVSVMHFYRIAPALLLAVAVSAAFEQSALALLPIYGADYGIGERIMSAMLATMIAGNIALQIPLGLFAERYSARAVMVFCALASIFSVLLLPLVMESLTVWPVLFVLGAVSYGIYTMSLIELGNRFSGSMLVTGNAAFGLMWGVGGIAGPPGSGVVMQVFGNHSLPFFLAMMCVALVLFSVYRELQRR